MQPGYIGLQAGYMRLQAGYIRVQAGYTGLQAGHMRLQAALHREREALRTRCSQLSLLLGRKTRTIERLRQEVSQCGAVRLQPYVTRL